MALSNTRPLQHHTLEQAMGAQRQKVVHQVIAICYCRKNTIDATRLFFRRDLLKTETYGCFAIGLVMVFVPCFLRVIGGLGHRFESCIGVVW